MQVSAASASADLQAHVGFVLLAPEAWKQTAVEMGRRGFSVQCFVPACVSSGAM